MILCGANGDWSRGTRDLTSIIGNLTSVVGWTIAFSSSLRLTLLIFLFTSMDRDGSSFCCFLLKMWDWIDSSYSANNHHEITYDFVVHLRLVDMHMSFWLQQGAPPCGIDCVFDCSSWFLFNNNSAPKNDSVGSQRCEFKMLGLQVLFEFVGDCLRKTRFGLLCLPFLVH